jgi:hypothetical protein
MNSLKKIPDGIVRSISIVTASDEVIAVYVDGIRKRVSVYDELTALELADMIEEENCNGKVIHIQRYTCEDFYDSVCLGNNETFEEMVPELLQHLKVDQ